MKKINTLFSVMSFIGIITATSQTTYNFSQENAVQNWTVPAGVTQIIIGVNAGAGGNGASGAGGEGATFNGTFTVTPGDNISIVVGGQGGFSVNGGGGGATYAYDSTTGTLLIVAGGGGGGGKTFGGYGGGTDLTNFTTTSPSNSGAGGTGGNGGTAATASAGAGWLSNGGGGSGGKDHANHFAGGGNGAYGGGGGGGGNCGGGGGGYNGGGGGGLVSSYGNGGGGGASYINYTYGVLNGGIGDGGSSYGSAYITVPPPPLSVTLSSQTNINCNGNYNGSATASASGGTSPYDYQWNDNNNQTNATATGLSQGSYTVTVTDNNSNTASLSVTITQPNVLSEGTPVLISNVTCYGENNGSATAPASGGTSPYTYQWNSGTTSTNATNNALSASTYTVFVTDANGCTATSSGTVTVNGPAAALSVNTSVTNILCNGGTGSAQAFANGGTSPYTYAWSSGATTSGIAGQTANTYTLTVQDNNGCTTTGSATISQPGALSDGQPVIISNVSCNGGNNGSAMASASGGTSPYTYQWNSGATSTNMINSALSAATYTVYLSDANGCTATSSGTATITQPSTPLISGLPCVPITLTNSQSTATGTNFQQMITVNSSNYNSYENSGLQNVEFSTGPSGSGTVLQAWIESGNTNSSASTIYWVNLGSNSIPAGGTLTIYMTFMPSSVLSSSGPTGEAPQMSGTYAEYDNGASVFGYYTNFHGTSLPSNWVTSNQANSVNNGLTLTSATSATAGYIGYNVSQVLPIVMDVDVTSWMSGTSSGSYGETWWGAGNGFNNPVTGTYVSLYLGNSSSTSGGWKFIDGSENTTASSNPTTGILTEAFSATSSSLSFNYGTKNTLSYAMTSPILIGGQRQEHSPAGTWKFQYMRLRALPPNNIMPTAAFGSVSSSAVVTANVSCNGGNNGSASISPNGGVSPYTYIWSSGETTSSISGKTANTYSVTVQDNAGCSVTSSVTITQPTALAANAIVTTNVSCNGNTNGSAQAAPGGGISPYTYIWSNSATTSTITNLTANTFTLTVHDNNGCSVTSSVTITQPAALAANMTVTSQAGCNGYNNGAAQSTITGGTSPYTYTWSNGSTTSGISSLTANTYTLAVQDNNGCTATGSVTITQSSAVVINWWQTGNVSCQGGNNGLAVSNLYGGTMPYTYLWSNGQTTGTLSDVTANTYTLTVTDVNGCMGTNSVTITQPSAPVTETITLNSNLTCHSLPPLNTPDGSATSNPSGGTPPYLYSWLPSGGTLQTSVTLPPGLDHCKVTDANGCSTTASVTLTQPTVVFATFTAKTIPSCNGTSDGSITAVGTGGSGIYTNYAWSPYGGSSATATGLSAQTYTVTITDNTGCLGTANVAMPQPAALAVSIPSYTCVVGGKAELEAVATGGTPAYVYSWSDGSTSVIGTKALETFADGSYTVAVADEHNCPKATASINFHSCPEIEGVVKGGDNGNGNSNNLSDITVYPNPTSGQFTIAGLEQGQLIEMYDYTGRKISTISASDITMQLNLSNQPSGIYLIRILDNNGNLVGMKKVVKTN